MSNPNPPAPTHWTPVDRKLWLTKHGAPPDFVLMTTLELAVVTNSLQELRRMSNALQLECGRLTVACTALEADKAQRLRAAADKAQTAADKAQYKGENAP